TARRAATQAYDVLAAVGGGIRGEAVSGIGSRVTSRLRLDGVLVDDGMTNASRALRMLDDTFAGGGRASGVVRFTDIERTRQRLVGMRKAAYRGDNGADQYAMGRLLDAFDDEVEGLFTRAMTEGGDEVLEAAKKARGLWAAYARKFHGKDKGSRFIQS